MCKIQKLIIILVICTSINYIYSEVVDNQLGKDLSKIFPELSKGYIDLNANEKADQDNEINEIIPESRVKDSIIQVQEILGFIEKNYRYIPIDKLKEVQNSLNSAKGEIPEVIALNYSISFDGLIAEKEKLGEEGLYLTPSARKEAIEKFQTHLSTLVYAYKKEGKKAEEEFVASRNEIIKMVKVGYPIPRNIGDEDKRVLVTSLLNTVSRSKVGNEEISSAIDTLGKLKDNSAVPYLNKYMENPNYRKDCIKALGNIGNKSSVPVLVSALEGGQDLELIIEALGDIGGEDGRDSLLGVLKSEENPVTEQSVLISIMKAFANIAAKGDANNEIFDILKEYTLNSNLSLKTTAIKGLGYFKKPEAAQNLLSLLKSEKDDDVKIWIIRALNNTESNTAVPAFIALLNDKNSTDKIKIETIKSISNNEDGVKATQYILSNLNSENGELRKACINAALKLYKVNPQFVTGNLSRLLLTSKDEMIMNEASKIFAEIADKSSVNTLIVLIQNQYPEVKKNATWAVFKVKPEANIRIITELQKLVTSETEPVDVRINSVRALGAMGFDAPNINIWQTLLTVSKLKGDRYFMLRYFAIRALGDLNADNPEVVNVLSKIALRDRDLEIKNAALDSIKRLSGSDEALSKNLLGLFNKEEDKALKIKIIEVLGDLKSDLTGELASRIIPDVEADSLKKKIIYALAKAGNERDYSIIIDLSKQDTLTEYIEAVLSSAEKSVLLPLIDRRVKIEKDTAILDFLEGLKADFEESF